MSSGAMSPAAVEQSALAIGDADLIVAGAGNIAGSLVPHLGCMRGVKSVTFVDFDSFETKNAATQVLSGDEIGRPKAIVLAERLRRANPALAVKAFVDAFENLPLGMMHDAILLGCLDSKLARLHVNRALWHGAARCWIDAGIQTEGLLARINVWFAHPGAACWQCGLSTDDSPLLEVRRACLGDRPATRSTDAPSCLGALAAALQALELRKILSGDLRNVAAGKQILIDASSHRHMVSTYRRDAACLFDHDAPAPEIFDVDPASLAIGSLLADAEAMRVEPQLFVRQLSCHTCGITVDGTWRLSGRMAAESCARCGGRLRIVGFSAADWLRSDTLPADDRRRSVAELGLCRGDVVTLAVAGGVRRVQIGARRLETRELGS